MDRPELQLFFVGVAGVFGLLVGSFLNVAIHRLPRDGMSVSNPRRSRCPKCGHELAWYENVPVVSWLIQRGRCRNCGVGISVRYPLVELLTASLWVTAAVLDAPRWDLFLVHALVLSGLVVATFVDFDFFEIPDEISIGGMVLAPLLCLLVPALHDETAVAQWMTQGWEAGAPVDRVGALLGSLAGLVAGGGVLLAIGWIGKVIYKQDAMGFGDVKLLAAGGGFIGPGGALAALLVGALIASVVGVANMLRIFWVLRSRVRRRGAARSVGSSIQTARSVGRYIPFGPYLGIGVGIVLFAWKDVLALLP